jgi:hypothetical protein
MTTRTDALNDAYERLAGFAYLDAPGFATHGPMGAETLSTLGHDDEVAAWADEYVRRHEPLLAPPADHRIILSDTNATAAALGDVFRVSDWAAAFRGELNERLWEEVLSSWVPRLLPGYAGALTHGMIRTAHAVRAVREEATPSPQMLDELAQGLALWAGTYKRLPGRPRLKGSLSLDQATHQLPRPAPAWSLFESGTFARIEELEGFPGAVESLGPQGSPDVALSLLSAHFCRVILAHPDVLPVPLVHTITPIGAARTLLPYLPGVSTEQLFGQLWQVGAAVTVAFAPRETSLVRIDEEPRHPEELLAQAVEHGDPHVLKFAEACAREHALDPTPEYLAATAHVIGQIPSWSAQKGLESPVRGG